MSNLFNNIGQRFQLRSVQEFFQTSAFKAPKDLGDLSNRLSGNIEYYQANYSVLVFLILMYVAYHQPSLLYLVAALGALGIWLFYVRKFAIQVSGRRFSENEVLLGYFVLSGTLLFYVGGYFLIYSLAFAGLLILIHAGLRRSSLTSKATNAANDVLDKFK